MPPHRFAIVNAVCLGQCSRVDEAIVDAFERGFVTTATLLAYGPTAVQAVAMASSSRRNDDSCFAGVVMSDSEKEAAQQEGTFHPSAPPPAACEQKDCTSQRRTPAHTQALPLGLMLTKEVAAAEEQSEQSTTTTGRARRKRSGASVAASTANKAQLPLPGTVERRVRQQIDWFTSLTGYPPMFVTAEHQIHTASPNCETLARLLPQYGIHWATFLEAASPVPLPPGHDSRRRSTLAQSRTARFVYGQHQLLTPQYEVEWLGSHPDEWSAEVGECKKGVTEIHLHFDTTSDRMTEAQRAVLSVCDQQQIRLVNHQQASALSDVHPTLPATLHELSIPAHYTAHLEPTPTPSVWHTLPSDLIHAFHAFLSPASFLLSRRTCRAWQKRALLPGAMWSKLLFHVHPHLPSSTLSRLSGTQLPIRKVKVTSKTVSAGSINELRSIGRLAHLTHLSLVRCTGVTDGLRGGNDWVANIGGLQHLVCDRCDLDDESLHLLALLPALVTLELSDCPVSQAGVATLARCSFPQLTTLKLLERHLGSGRRNPQYFDDDERAFKHILAATYAVPTSSAEGAASEIADSGAVAPVAPKGVRWPRLLELDLSFSVLFPPDREVYNSYVDAVYAFRRARPQISLRTGLESG